MIKEIPEDFEVEEKEPWYKGPIKVIIGLFLLLMVVMWIVPHYGIKQNPEPNYTPLLEELSVSQMQIPEVDSDYIYDYVLVDSEIKRLADRIVTLSCPNTNKVCNAKAIFYFVQKNFDYVNDPLDFEYYKTPHESFISENGDCDDTAIVLASLLRAVGLQTRFVKVPRHVYLQVKIPEAISSYKTNEGWINLDSSCKNCGFGEINFRYSKSHKEFLS
jgi:transglutaminase-like putative cysteine protease